MPLSSFTLTAHGTRDATLKSLREQRDGAKPTDYLTRQVVNALIHAVETSPPKAFNFTLVASGSVSYIDPDAKPVVAGGVGS